MTKLRQFPPTSTNFTPRKGVVMPNLAWLESPNQSQRLHGMRPYLIVMHRPVGKYGPSINWLRNAHSDSSAHIITEGNGTGVDVATQLVPWDQKAWACSSFNSASYNIEADDDAWDGDDWGAFYTAARIAGFICVKTGIPPVWQRQPLRRPGIVRHLDLGLAGGGHSDPTKNPVVWHNFIEQVAYDVRHGGYRRTYGHGRFLKIKEGL